jgi:hypothetical protein
MERPRLIGPNITEQLAPMIKGELGSIPKFQDGHRQPDFKPRNAAMSSSGSWRQSPELMERQVLQPTSLRKGKSPLSQRVTARAAAPTARPVVRTATAPALTVVLAANAPAPTTARAAHAFNENAISNAARILIEDSIM